MVVTLELPPEGLESCVHGAGVAMTDSTAPLPIGVLRTAIAGGQDSHTEGDLGALYVCAVVCMSSLDASSPSQHRVSGGCEARRCAGSTQVEAAILQAIPQRSAAGNGASRSSVVLLRTARRTQNVL